MQSRALISIQVDVISELVHCTETQFHFYFPFSTTQWIETKASVLNYIPSPYVFF